MARATTSRRVALKPALRKVLVRVNAARARHDLAALTVSRCLTRRFAQPWAEHMAQTETMVHQDLAPMFTRCSGLRTVGENIAAGYRSAASVVRAWLNSPGHRANILNPDFTRIGLGLAAGAGGTRYWVQDFGG